MSDTETEVTGIGKDSRMLYEEARVYLDGVSKYGSVLGLDSIRNLLEELDHPQKDLKFIQMKMKKKCIV